MNIQLTLHTDVAVCPQYSRLRRPMANRPRGALNSAAVIKKCCTTPRAPRSAQARAESEAEAQHEGEGEEPADADTQALELGAEPPDSLQESELGDEPGGLTQEEGSAVVCDRSDDGGSGDGDDGDDDDDDLW
eukprot:COSAG01_NODE_142_length_24198_cov_8.924893_3_plen_133_part_00